jgi:uncharacterized protein YndB with AHSA1/START domain
MRLRAHDQGFVGALPADVYRALDEPATYPEWWPGARVEGTDVVLPVARGGPPATCDIRREGVGLFLRFGEDSLEWFLEPFDDGTIVNAFLDVDEPGSMRRSARRLLRGRHALRRGLVGLKKRLEDRR